MAKGVRIEIDTAAAGELLNDPEIKALIMGIAEGVQGAAAATASDAENGSGGTIDGYAAAGFSAEWDARGKRPRAVVASNADGQTAMSAHFHTQRRDGVAHLRAALYRFTKRG